MFPIVLNVSYRHFRALRPLTPLALGRIGTVSASLCHATFMADSHTKYKYGIWDSREGDGRGVTTR